ncbi:hypothetical protein KEM63_01315 [Halopseudomonas nanhaiensis]|uniref:FkbM family methyltransferase n=1 Tax=Halopseudomonas nanhaiensis TaxID=2830842 RepID=UPI001CBBC4BE|nr:FkbM family methyltransferase [Halopseudomonas nanhaiensis]UAW98653.1 hypothetical protein KEM63_01315 [Halopseudomonas nanhaiensis]
MREPLIDQRLVEHRKHLINARGLSGWPTDTSEDLLQIKRIGLWLKALKEPTVVQHPYLPLSMRVDSAFPPRLAYYFLVGDYEQSDLELISEHVVPGDRVLELGGGVGVTASWAARCSGQAIVVVEPNRVLHGQIAVNIALNGQAGRVVDGMAVSDAHTTESITLGIHEDFWWSGAQRVDQFIKQVECKALKISELLAHHKPSVLVVDIEGLETTLFPCRLNPELRLILVEIHTPDIGDRSTVEVINAISEMGLKLSRVRAHSWLFRRETREVLSGRSSGADE